MRRWLHLRDFHLYPVALNVESQLLHRVVSKAQSQSAGQGNFTCLLVIKCK